MNVIINLLLHLSSAFVPDSNVEEREFGKIQTTAGIASVRAYRLFNTFVDVTILSYGCTIQSMLVRDRTGIFDDVITGFDNISGYLTNKNYHGGIVGRYANRIHKAQFYLDGQTYKLNPSQWDSNNIHGGTFGFDKKLWKGNKIKNGVELFYRSPDGEEGFPGELTIIVTFTLVGSSLEILYEARTTKATVINLTHHTYFNLNGHLSWNTIDDLHLTIPSNRRLDVDEENIPTGRILENEGTIYDFRAGKYLTAALIAETPNGYGIDNNYCFPDDSEYRQLAILVSPRSGRLLEVKSTQPGLQVYTANWIDSTGKFNIHYGKNTAICLEPQHWPDSPNHPSFPSTVLRPGESYSQVTKLSFYRV